MPLPNLYVYNIRSAPAAPCAVSAPACCVLQKEDEEIWTDNKKRERGKKNKNKNKNKKRQKKRSFPTSWRDPQKKKSTSGKNTICFLKIR